MISRREVSGHGCLLALPEHGEEPQRQHRGGEEAAFFMHPQERKTKNEVEQKHKGAVASVEWPGGTKALAAPRRTPRSESPPF